MIGQIRQKLRRSIVQNVLCLFNLERFQNGSNYTSNTGHKKYAELLGYEVDPLLTEYRYSLLYE